MPLGKLDPKSYWYFTVFSTIKLLSRLQLTGISQSFGANCNKAAPKGTNLHLQYFSRQHIRKSWNQLYRCRAKKLKERFIQKYSVCFLLAVVVSCLTRFDFFIKTSFFSFFYLFTINSMYIFFIVEGDSICTFIK